MKVELTKEQVDFIRQLLERVPVNGSASLREMISLIDIFEQEQTLSDPDIGTSSEGDEEV